MFGPVNFTRPDSPSHRLHQPVIQERCADLQAVGHAHPIDLDQHVVGQRGLEIHVQDAVDGVAPAGTLVGALGGGAGSPLATFPRSALV